MSDTLIRMAQDDKREPKQYTQPKKGKPAEIPVPKRGDVLRDLKKVAKPRPRN